VTASDAMLAGRTSDERWRKRLALVACIMASGIVGVDGTMSSVALPAIADGLNAGLRIQQWVIASYSLGLGGLMLVGGALGDIYDRWRIFGVGVAGFGVAAVLCALAPNAAVLIGARALQGTFVALIIPSTLAVITNTFDGAERARAIGSLTAWGGLSMMIGPLLGGALVATLSWRAVFSVSVPLAAVALVLIVRLSPSNAHHPKNGTLDVLGAVLGILAVGGPVFAFIEQSSLGWGDPLVWGCMVVGICALVGFLLQERGTTDPLLPLDFFRSRTFTVMNLVTFLLYGAMNAAQFFIIIFVQQVVGYGPIEAGLALIPVYGLMFLLSALFGSLSDRVGATPFIVGGSLCFGTGLLLATLLDADSGYFSVLFPVAVLLGLGLSLALSPLTATVLAAADEHHAGIASGVNNAIARIAGLLFIAVVGGIVSAHFASSLDRGLEDRQLGSEERAAVADKAQPLSGGIDARGLDPGERELASGAVEAASETAFRLGIGIIGVLAVAGAVLCAVAVRKPHRRWDCRAAHVPGGALIGAHRKIKHHHRAPIAPQSTNAGE
jgi:EmrB/QacA subfamily drug resistance transporter